jgi:hypothetical protein
MIMMIVKRIVRFRKIQRLFGLVQPKLSQDDIFGSGGTKGQKKWKYSANAESASHYFKNNY